MSTTLALILAACGRGIPEGSTIPDSEAVAYGEQRLGSAASEGGGLGSTFEEYLTSWRQPGFVQRYTGVNFNSMEVVDEVERADGSWVSVTHKESATFFVWSLAAAGVDEFALLGTARDDDVVIELWTLTEGSGTVVEHGDLGTAVPSYELVPKHFNKRRVFKGFQGHGVIGIEVDPDLRFVVFTTRAPDGVTAVYQLDCTDPDALPVELADSDAIPELDSAVQIQKFGHATLGRIYQADAPLNSDWVVMFVDVDNDGVFDGSPLVEGVLDRPYGERVPLNR